MLRISLSLDNKLQEVKPGQKRSGEVTRVHEKYSELLLCLLLFFKLSKLQKFWAITLRSKVCLILVAAIFIFIFTYETPSVSFICDIKNKVIILPLLWFTIFLISTTKEIFFFFQPIWFSILLIFDFLYFSIL